MFRLEPMDEATYQAWRERTTRLYAEEKVSVGNWAAADAEELSAQEFERLLPQGRATPGQEIRAMVNDAGDRVGQTWFKIEDRDPGRVVFIYDIEVSPDHRRR